MLKAISFNFLENLTSEASVV